jgi:hypothetical protein
MKVINEDLNFLNFPPDRCTLDSIFSTSAPILLRSTEVTKNVPLASSHLMVARGQQNISQCIAYELNPIIINKLAGELQYIYGFRK